MIHDSGHFVNYAITTYKSDLGVRGIISGALKRTVKPGQFAIFTL